jgi:hypothetical protein
MQQRAAQDSHHALSTTMQVLTTTVSQPSPPHLPGSPPSRLLLHAPPRGITSAGLVASLRATNLSTEERWWPPACAGPTTTDCTWPDVSPHSSTPCRGGVYKTHDSQGMEGGRPNRQEVDTSAHSAFSTVRHAFIAPTPPPVVLNTTTCPPPPTPTHPHRLTHLGHPLDAPPHHTTRKSTPQCWCSAQSGMF